MQLIAESCIWTARFQSHRCARGCCLLLVSTVLPVQGARLQLSGGLPVICRGMQWLLLIDAAVAGIIAHCGLFIRVEWHLEGPKVMFGHIALGSLAWWFFLRHESVTISEHIRLCSLVFGSYIISLFSSIVIYRLFFHRLRDFPGSRLAAASKLWHIFKCRHSKNFRILEDTYRQYGQFVRTGKLSCFSDPVDLGFKESELTTR